MLTIKIIIGLIIFCVLLTEVLGPWLYNVPLFPSFRRGKR